MPMWKYVCKDCKEETLILSDFPNDTPTVLCDKCEKPMLREIGQVSFAFNGKGFYTTDYKDKK